MTQRLSDDKQTSARRYIRIRQDKRGKSLLAPIMRPFKLSCFYRLKSILVIDKNPLSTLPVLIFPVF